jgi:hypothetical protein
MPRDYRPPNPKTVSTFIYLAVLIMAVLIAYVAIRALFT